MEKLKLLKFCLCIMGIGYIMQGLLFAVVLPLTGAPLHLIAKNSAHTAIQMALLILIYPDDLQEIWRMLTKDYRR